MASVTRSNRRAEGLHHAARQQLNARGHNQQHPSARAVKDAVELYAAAEDEDANTRQKRTLEPADGDVDALKSKKTRIAVEILARQQQQQQQQQQVLLSAQGVRTSAQHEPALVLRPPPISPAPAAAAAVSVPNTATTITNTTTITTANKAAPRNTVPSLRQSSLINSSPLAASVAQSHPYHASSPLPSQPIAPRLADDESNLKHHHKTKGVAEPDRMQPKAAAAPEQGRKLRSQEATRFKSDLSAYFPEYDEVIGNDPKEQHLLNLDTPIVVLDSNPRNLTAEIPRVGARAQQPTRLVALDTPVRGYGDSLYTDVFDAQRIDFGFLEIQQTSKNSEDPLPDSLFKPSHKRAERLERSIRNTEKGRAQHEKDQIIRLLEGLQGPDWLRIMGVSGVTETKKKSFEPARMHFIKGCQGILEKFRNWNLEEKRRKLEKEKAIQAEQQASLEQEQQQKQQQKQQQQKQQQQQQQQHHGQRRRPKSEIEDSEDDDVVDVACFHPDTSEPDRDQADEIEDSEDVVTSQSDTSDASPAKQLRQEALARSHLAAASSKKPRGLCRPTAPKPVDPPREFTSFFGKKYERDSALNRPRRTGRKILAWGHPIPDMDQSDFVLPEEYRDEECLKARARKKRRDKRHGRT